jgi:poly(3-hydroxybutyrate) depolymerase
VTAGCGLAVSDTEASSIAVGDRTFLLALPENYDPKNPYPLVFSFHGRGSNGAEFRSWARVEEAAAGQAIFVYPDGPDGEWEDEVYHTEFDFYDAVMDILSAAYCIDLNAVFAFGFSYGGWAVTQFACERPSLLRGIAPIAGGGPGAPCTSSMPTMIIHGTADTAQDIYRSEETRDLFLLNNGCIDAVTPIEPSPCVSYNECTDVLVWCAHEGEHIIPLFAPAAIWAFFDGLRP